MRVQGLLVGGGPEGWKCRGRARGRIGGWGSGRSRRPIRPTLYIHKEVRCPPPTTGCCRRRSKCGTTVGGTEPAAHSAQEDGLAVTWKGAQH